MPTAIGTSEQQTTDFDWFGVDEDGLIAHFTTAGFKSLPRTVALDAEALKTIQDYFLKQAPVRGSHVVDPDLVKQIGTWPTKAHRGRYLRSFVFIAERGLFSFDIKTYVEPGSAYFRVASPEQALRMAELPGDIQASLSKTILKGVKLKSRNQILYEATLNF